MLEMDAPLLTHDEYTVGWVAILPCEIDAARLLLNREHQNLPALHGDTNSYILGDMGGHNVAIAFPGAGRKGVAPATDTATNMIRTFSKIRFGLLVGVAGGVPKVPPAENSTKDIRLGDIVVGCPDRNTGGVIQLDSGKWLQADKIDVQSHLNKPPIILLTAVEKLRGDLKFRKAQLESFIKYATDKALELDMDEYGFPGRQNDRLFQSEHVHKTPEEGEGCSQCVTGWEVQRNSRPSEKPIIHYGLIGSSNQVVWSADYRNRMQNFGVLCFEMEAAGLMDTFPCLVIRGISDYSDSHKNKLWQPYAALTAAAYARDLLRVVQALHVQEAKLVIQVVQKLDSITNAVESVGTNIVNAYNQGQASEETREIQRRQERDNDLFDEAMNKLRDELLSTNGASMNLSQGSRQEPHPGTCTWLFDDSRFKKWIDEKADTPVLWLWGAPRAGKTVLCTAAIDHVKEKRGIESTIYAYVSDSAEFSPSQLLSNLALQLLDNLRKCKSCLYKPIDLQQFIGVSRKDDRDREKLVSRLIEALPVTYIFIDGIDGADHYTVRQNSMSLASYERERPEQNMKRILNFLCSQTKEYGPKVRLWCSSQFDSMRRRAWIGAYDKLTLDFQLQLDDTQKDIVSYLLECIDRTFPSIEHGPIFLSLLLHVIKIQGSFSWAKLLHDEIEQQPDRKSLTKLLEDEKLPGSINKYYEKYIKLIKDRERRRVEPALWKIVLSLVMYAKRPLLKSEIIDAIAILRTKSGDLDPDYKPRDESVLNACRPLVKIISQKGEKKDDPIITLHDGGVREFLQERLELNSEHMDDQLVDAGIVRDGCFRYLMQPKYSKFLKKIDAGTFETLTNEDIISHKFLGYSVKYWHQHFDTPSEEPPPEAESKKVQKFVSSTNFATCVQVQSLIVEGHFAHRIDAITDQAASTKRVFPNWFLKNEVFRQYSMFSSEWSELLQSGFTSELNGELDRCIWASLGRSHFLSRLPCRYEGFNFATEEAETNGSARYWIQKLSPNHEYITSCYFNASQKNHYLDIMHWRLGGSGNGSLQTLMFNRQDVALDSYQLPCSSFIPLIPSLSCLEPPCGLSIFPNSSVIRVGSKLFTGICPEEPSTGPKNISTLDDGIGNFWEDVYSQNDIMVACRRRVPRASNSYKGPSPAGGFYSDNSSDAPDSDEEVTEPNLSLFREMQTREDMMTMDIESAEESWSDSDKESGANSAADSFSILSDGPEMADSEQNDADGENPILDCNFSDYGDFSAGYATDYSGGGGNYEPEDSGTESASESDSIQSIVTCSQWSQDEDEAKIQALVSGSSNNYAVTIWEVGPDLTCDACDSDLPRRRYSCNICRLSFCRKCVGARRAWCPDKNHQLIDLLDGKAVRAITKPKFTVRQELQVYRIRNGVKVSEILFRYRGQHHVLLHDSPPIIHPLQPLVVWPLSGCQLLFADFEKNSYFEVKLRSNALKGRPICLNMSFSPCGRMLRVAKIEAVFEIKGEAEVVDWANCKEEGPPRSQQLLRLKLHIVILNLSKSKPTKAQPTLVGSATLDIGCSVRPLVHHLPFAFTWRPKHLYVTVSSSRLRVYRIDMNLVMAQSTAICPAKRTWDGTVTGPVRDEKRCVISTPKETIFLPRSARVSTVQYLPPNADISGNRSVIVVGPRSGKCARPGFCIYLTEQDLGEWIDPAKKPEEESRLLPGQQRLSRMYEMFHTEKDCDVIPCDY